MTAEHDPPVVIVISTRNRGGSVCQTVRTALANDYPRFSLTVVDQSEGDDTARALEPFLDNPRLRYVRTTTRGVSKGRNVGIRDASAELIGITDDDCEIPTGWVRSLVAAFATDQRIGIVFGNVLPGPHDSARGFIPIYARHAPTLARSMRDKHHVEGISACMGIRRDTWRALGGFDERLGAGAPLRSGAETDLTIRALLTGAFVYETPALSVVHHGFRTWQEGRALMDGYWYGTGATFAKLLKCGHGSLLGLLLRLGWRWAFGRSPVAASSGPRAYRLLRLASFVRGLAAGARAPVDRATGHFRPLPSTAGRR
jgi:GT2 family glycosyltransferase